MRISTVLVLVGAICLPLMHAAPAQAQATQTWVSGVGSDANPCSRTAPCKTFAGAIAKTATGGEINCLDPGAFGGLTITNSIAIICQAGTASVQVSGTNGITVNTSAGAIVKLQGLDIEGIGTGLIGISFTGAGTLHIEDCVIRGFNAGSGFGIGFTPTGVGKLFVSDSYISDNGTVGGASTGIEIKPGTGGSATVVLNRVESNNNTGAGFRADGSGASSSPAIYATIVYSGFSGNVNSGIAATTAGSNAVYVVVNYSTSSNNGSNGLAAQATAATIEVGSSTVSGNTTGINTSGGGQALSTGNNPVGGNISPGAISGPAPVL